MPQLLHHIFVQERTLDLVDGRLTGMRLLREKHPDLHGQTDVVPLTPVGPTLVLLNPRCLFRFPMKLFNLPSDGGLFSNALRRILNSVIGDDVFRFVGGDKNPEQFHFVVLGESSDFDGLSRKERVVTPEQRIDRMVGLRSVRIVHHPILFDRAIEGLFQRIDPQERLGIGVPAVHEDGLENNASL